MRMDRVTVAIKGESPLLMHRISAELYNKDYINPCFDVILSKGEKKRLVEWDKGKGKNDVLPDDLYAKLHAYWMPDGSSLCIPADCLRESVKDVAKMYRVAHGGSNRKSSLKMSYSGSVFFEPAFIPLGTKDYELDVRTVVIGKARIVRCRALVPEWKADFVVDWISDAMPKGFEDTIPELISEAGVTRGIMDYRPQKGGRFGRFSLVDHKHIPNGGGKPL